MLCRLLLPGLVFVAACASAPPMVIPPDVPAEYLLLPRADDASGIQPPKILRRVEPVAPREFIGSGRRVVASVGAAISESGTVEAVWRESGDPVWARSIAAALRQWRFAPATKDGHPVAIRFSLTATFTSTGGPY